VETGSARAIFSAPERERTKRFISTINAAHTYDIWARAWCRKVWAVFGRHHALFLWFRSGFRF